MTSASGRRGVDVSSRSEPIQVIASLTHGCVREQEGFLEAEDDDPGRGRFDSHQGIRDSVAVRLQRNKNVAVGYRNLSVLELGAETHSTEECATRSCDSEEEEGDGCADRDLQSQGVSFTFNQRS